MRRSSIVIFFLTLALIWLVTVAYLAGTFSMTSPPSGNQTPKKTDVGLLPLPGTDQPLSISFEDATDQLSIFLLEKEGISSNITLYYIRGMDLDPDGNAGKWLFGVRYGNQSALMYYDRTGWSSVPWEGGLPGQEIVTGLFIPPKEIIRRNTVQIFSGMPSKDDRIRRLELGNDIYTLSVYRQGTPQVLSFDAATGVLIPAYA